jgi:hypothetical protein
MVELIGRSELSRRLGCRLKEVERKVGPASCEIRMRRTERPAWFLNLIEEGISAPGGTEPVPFYSIAEIVKLYESVRWRVEKILGEPDALLYEGRLVLPLWSSESLDAGFTLINDLRAKGDSTYNRKRPFKRRVSALQRKRTESRKSGFFTSGLRPQKKIGPVQALHRWAGNLSEQRAKWR